MGKLILAVAVLCGSVSLAHSQGGIAGSGCPGNGGTGTSTAFTAGSVVFATSNDAGCGQTGAYGQKNAHLFWDNTNNRLGVGTASPATKIHASSGTVTLDGNAPALNITGVASTTDPFLVGVSTFIIKGNTGRVGVGTANPATLVNISSGTLTIDGNVAPTINVNEAIRLGSFTSTQISSKVPGAAGELIFNSTIGNTCVSTGTLAQQYKLTGTASTACN